MIYEAYVKFVLIEPKMSSVFVFIPYGFILPVSLPSNHGIKEALQSREGNE